MPTYEYKCDSCDFKFEEWQSIKAKPINKCPKCNKKVRRIISSGAGFIFKGEGFYKTDYRSKEYKEKQKAEKTKTDKKKTETKKEDKKNKEK